MRFIKARAVVPFICLLTLCISCAGNRELMKKKARAREDLGLSYVREGNLKAGVEHLREAAKLDPGNADIHNELALTYRDLGAYEEALVHFKKALALKPEFSEAYNNLGTLYLLLEKWDLAIGCFEKAVSNITYKTPHFSYNNLGLAYYNKGEYYKAIEGYRQALKLSPSYAICYTNLGLAYEAIDSFQAAIEAHKKSIDHAPDYPASHFNLARLYLRLNQNDEATKELKRTVEIDPEGNYGNEAKRLLQETTPTLPSPLKGEGSGGGEKR